MLLEKVKSGSTGEEGKRVQRRLFRSFLLLPGRNTKRDDVVANVLFVLFSLSVLLTAAVAVFYAVYVASYVEDMSGRARVLVTIYFVLLGIVGLGNITVIVYGFRMDLKRLRSLSHVVIALLIMLCVVNIATWGVSYIEISYLFQIACLVFFQLYTDQELARNKTLVLPWDRDQEPKRKEYIPLNFFNLFWVFTIASVLGLVMETILIAFQYGGYYDRAGALWGPFSPIYGCGAVLMTVALNRVWNKNKLAIFCTAGLIGAAFEFFASWFFETSFGIVAWDYRGTFLNVDGRTDFAHFCAWGFIGLVWIRLLLPDTLKLVDAIPLRWRAAITILAAAFMLVDCSMTIMALDCWYMRASGAPVDNPVQEFFAQHYGDEFMEVRFDSMSLNPDQASRS